MSRKPTGIRKNKIVKGKYKDKYGNITNYRNVYAWNEETQKYDIRIKPKRSDRIDRGDILIDKEGNETEALKRYKNKLKSEVSKTDYKFIETKIKQWRANHKGEELKKVTFSASVAKSKQERAFANAGYTLDQAAAEIGTTKDALINKMNWVKDKNNRTVFKDPLTGAAFIFVWRQNYTGSIWEATKI